MKGLIFLSIGLFILAFLSSCQKEDYGPQNEEVFSKIVGRWEADSIYKIAYTDGKLNASSLAIEVTSYNPYPQSGEVFPDYLVALQFRDDGKIYHVHKQSGAVSTNMTWKVDKGILKFSDQFNLPDDVKCDILNLTKTDFQFILSWEYELLFGGTKKQTWNFYLYR